MSRIPAVLDRLVAAFTVALPQVQVIDGPALVEVEEAGLCVGYTPDRLAVESTEEGVGLDATLESFDVNCLAWQRSGDTDTKTLRDRAFATVAAVDAVLAVDRRLGGVVVNAQLRVVDLEQTQTEDTTWAVIAFVITCKAFK